MVDKTIIPVEYLSSILDSVYEYNNRGKVIGITFHSQNQERVDIGYIEVVAEGMPLKVRSRPESEDDKKPSSLAEAYGLDPRLVPGPASMSELAAKSIGE